MAMRNRGVPRSPSLDPAARVERVFGSWYIRTIGKEIYSAEWSILYTRIVSQGLILKYY